VRVRARLSLFFLVSQKDDSLKGKRVAISGAGNVATYAAEKCLQLGATVITLSDSTGYVYEPEGFTKEARLKSKASCKSHLICASCCRVSAQIEMAEHRSELQCKRKTVAHWVTVGAGIMQAIEAVMHLKTVARGPLSDYKSAGKGAPAVGCCCQPRTQATSAYSLVLADVGCTMRRACTTNPC